MIPEGATVTPVLGPEFKSRLSIQELCWFLTEKSELLPSVNSEGLRGTLGDLLENTSGFLIKFVLTKRYICMFQT